MLGGSGSRGGADPGVGVTLSRSSWSSWRRAPTTRPDIDLLGIPLLLLSLKRTSWNAEMRLPQKITSTTVLPFLYTYNLRDDVILSSLPHFLRAAVQLFIAFFARVEIVFVQFNLEDFRF